MFFQAVFNAEKPFNSSDSAIGVLCTPTPWLGRSATSVSSRSPADQGPSVSAVSIGLLSNHVRAVAIGLLAKPTAYLGRSGQRRDFGQMERAAGLAHDDTPQARLDKLDDLLAQTSTSIEDADGGA